MSPYGMLEASGIKNIYYNVLGERPTYPPIYAGWAPAWERSPRRLGQDGLCRSQRNGLVNNSKLDLHFQRYNLKHVQPSNVFREHRRDSQLSSTLNLRSIPTTSKLTGLDLHALSVPCGQVPNGT